MTGTRDGITVLDRAEVRPALKGAFATSGVFHNGRALEFTHLAPHLCRDRDLSLASPVYDDSSEALYLGCFYNCWGHSITDSLRFLWVFLPQYVQRIESKIAGLKLVYVTAHAEEPNLGNNFVELLRMLGLPVEKLVRIQRPTRFSKVYVPDPCFWEDEKIARHCSKQYEELIDFFKSRIPMEDCSPSKTIYFSRSHWQRGLQRKDFGEITIERAIRKNVPECEFVAPETLSFSGQLRLLASCRKLITTEGSLAHNLIFLPRGAECVILQKSYFPNRYQKALNELRDDVKVTVVKAYAFNHLQAKYSNPVIGPFFLCVTRELARYLGCRRGFSVKERVLYEVVFLRRMLRNGLWRLVRYVWKH